MSYVINILLLTGIDEPGASVLSAWISEHEGPANTLKQVDQYCTGGKHFEAKIYGVAVNYCAVNELIEKFHSIDWGDPDQVHLLIKEQEDDLFKVYTPEAKP